MKPEYSLKLSKSDRANATWKKLQTHFEYLLNRERKRNDGKMSQDDTCHCRGKISILKELIAMQDVSVESDEDEVE